jgi:hypothetical protein
MLVRTNYEQFIYSLPMQFPSIRLSMLVLVPPRLTIGELTGLIAFGDDIVLCVYELLDFEQGLILAYRYEVTRCIVPFTSRPLPEADTYCRVHYPNKEKLYWYDSWPHPNHPSLASTHPHHKHIHPDIKHHRIPAPDLRFDGPNLPFLIEEIERELLQLPADPC